MDEPAPLVAAMVAHHLDQGAGQVFLYLDRPDAGLRALVGHLPGVVITDCDAGYWAAVRHSGRHRDHVWRQVINANHAYARARVDWLLHCDADEFLSDGPALRAELAGLPPGVHSLILPNVERVFARGRVQRGLFDGPFRRPRQRWRGLGWLVQGRQWRHFQRGLSAHALGKSVTRTRCGRWLEIHRCARQANTDRPTCYAKAQGTAVIVHFDGLTPAHWQAKMARLRAEMPLRSYGRLSPTRRHVMARLAAAGAADASGERAGSRTRAALRSDAASARAEPLAETAKKSLAQMAGEAPAEALAEKAALARAFVEVQTLSLWQRVTMAALGLIWRGRIDPGAALARLCPGAAVSVAEFDALLEARFAGQREAAPCDPAARSPPAVQSDRAEVGSLIAL